MNKALQHVRSTAELAIIVSLTSLVVWGVPRYGDQFFVFILDIVFGG